MVRESISSLKHLVFLVRGLKLHFRVFESNYLYKFKRKPTPLASPKTTLECLQQYAEKVVIDSGINLENVLVHNLGQFGFAGWSYDFETYTIFKDIRYDFKIPHAKTPYIVVPEISTWWEFRAWLHEVGHYHNRHYCDSIKPTYVKEFEAEIFCVDMAKKCEYIDYQTYKLILHSARQYLFEHMLTAIRDKTIKKYEDFPQKILDFVTNDTIAEQELKAELNRVTYSQMDGCMDGWWQNF